MKSNSAPCSEHAQNQDVASKTADGTVNLDTLRWPLLSAQAKLAPMLPWIQGACEVAARILRRPVRRGRENTRRCYETLFDPLCAETGVWPDYTEGYYPEGNESYDDAKRKQFDYILDQTECGPGTRVLDLGCGNGQLMKRARDRGCNTSGITISRTQAASCQAEGLDVRVCSFDEAPDVFGADAFDVIILNGPTEHFVSEQDAALGRGKAIVRQLFDALALMLRPGGRIFITCIHFRWATDANKVCRPVLSFEPGSYYFYCSNLVDIYSGWYPDDGMYERTAADVGFETLLSRDATRDYYLTSKHWSTRLQRYLRDHPGFAARFVVDFLVKDPRYFFSAFIFWFYDPWTWQFRPTSTLPTPMIHRWLMFRSSSHRHC